jgi:hypothetical protein
MLLLLKLRSSLLLLCLLLTLPLFLCREVKRPNRSKVKVGINGGPMHMPARHPLGMRPASQGVSTAGAPTDEGVSIAATMAEMRFPCSGSASTGCYEVTS